MSDEKQKQKVHFSFAYLAVAMLLFLAIQYFLAGEHVQRILYSDFKQLLSQGKVREAVVSAETIQGQMVDPEAEGKLHAFVTTRVDDPSLVQELQEKGVKYTGKTSSSILRLFLSWVVPLFLFLVLWNFLMRRVGAGGHGILSVGSRGRIVVLDLQLPDGTPWWLSGLLLPLVKPFAVTEEVIGRRPWRLIQSKMGELFAETEYREFYGGTAYLLSAAGAARRQTGRR
jgi:hypothetical protein